MRTSLVSTLGAVLLLSAPVSAVTMAWTPIGNPGNACDLQSPAGCFGAVNYSYSIGTYEVTNAQYAAFLNAKAASDPLGLYNGDMGLPFPSPYHGSGITRSGSDGSFTYSAIAGRENMPVNYVSFWEALRFANWMNNGQGSGDTETGAYTLLGGTATPSNGTTVTRNAGATIFLPSENEWYKAAYYSASSTSYFDYPAGTNTQTACTAPGATANTANCYGAANELTPVGSYAGSASPYGTFDQGGNLQEWNEAIIGFELFGLQYQGRGLRGGHFESPEYTLAASFRNVDFADTEYLLDGFRVAMIPEPSTGLLVIAGLLGLAGWRRGRV